MTTAISLTLVYTLLVFNGFTSAIWLKQAFRKQEALRNQYNEIFETLCKE